MSTPRFHRLSLGTKLTAANMLIVALLFGAFVIAISVAMTRTVEAQARADLDMQTRVLSDMIRASAQDLRERSNSLAQAFETTLKGRLELRDTQVDVKGRPTPVLALDGKVLNLDFSAVDAFSETTGSVATIFVRSGEDFVRVSTSVKNEKGERAIGTLLDREHPGYKAISQGQRYVGAAQLFGRHYMTQYAPLTDASGRIVGVAFVGLDFSKLIEQMKTSIRAMKIGETGYFFVIDAKPGKTLGNALVHPSSEGKSLLEATDAEGKPFIRNMLDSKSGVTRYGWIDQEGKPARDKITAYRSVDELHWLIGGGSYIDELTASTLRMRNLFLGIAVAMLALMAAFSWLLIRKQVIRPLAQVRRAAEAIATGDLTVRVNSQRGDEVGRLMDAINQVGVNLTEVVETVRQNSESVASASSQIEQGNQDLSARTESQAASLEQTAAAMQELGSTVQNNAGRAVQANERALEASRVAERSGQVMGQVALTMKDISASSQRIADITSIIDGLAFQTNILALNAAVESARAGDAGRGFAVVATEVRSLAARSAEAAKEIKGLIAASVARVEAGGELVDQAGATMSQLVNSIGEVTRAMADISIASQEQAGGVTEVGTAVAQMDQNTQQNSALVEEMAAAASSLRGQADSLVQTVSMFKLEQAAA